MHLDRSGSRAEAGPGTQRRSGRALGQVRSRRARGRAPGAGWAKWPGGAGARWFEVRAPGGLRFGRNFLGEMQNSMDFGEGLDPLAKQQIHGPKQPNLTRSNKLQEKILGLFLWGFSNLDEKQQNQASKWGDGTPRCE